MVSITFSQSLAAHRPFSSRFWWVRMLCVRFAFSISILLLQPSSCHTWMPNGHQRLISRFHFMRNERIRSPLNISISIFLMINFPWFRTYAFRSHIDFDASVYNAFRREHNSTFIAINLNLDCSAIYFFQCVCSNLRSDKIKDLIMHSRKSCTTCNFMHNLSTTLHLPCLENRKSSTKNAPKRNFCSSRKRFEAFSERKVNFDIMIKICHSLALLPSCHGNEKLTNINFGIQRLQEYIK